VGSVWLTGVWVAFVAIALLAAGFFGARAILWQDVALPSPSALAAQASAAASSAASASGGLAEVPSVTGLRADEALVILKTAGFRVEFRATGAPVSRPESRTVSAQVPSAGSVLAVDTTVTLTAPSLSGSPTAVTVAAPKPGSGFVVCIDPGHQAHFDSKLEPVGPGSKTLKPRMTGGLTGVASGLPEYELALQLSVNLKRRLESTGMRVVLTRTTNDVDLANSARALVANGSKADLFVRVHANASTDASSSGVATVYPARNVWTHKITSRSERAATLIQGAVCRACGAVDAGVSGAQGFAGFNWAKVPTIMVEAGYLSNPVEDRLLASPSYQDKLAQGMCDGILAYLKSEAN